MHMVHKRAGISALYDPSHYNDHMGSCISEFWCLKLACSDLETLQWESRILILRLEHQLTKTTWGNVSDPRGEVREAGRKYCGCCKSRSICVVGTSIIRGVDLYWYWIMLLSSFKKLLEATFLALSGPVLRSRRRRKGVVPVIISWISILHR